MPRYCNITFDASIFASIDVDLFKQETGLEPTKHNLIDYAMGNWSESFKSPLMNSSVFRGEVALYECDPPTPKKKVRKGIGSY